MLIRSVAGVLAAVALGTAAFFRVQPTRASDDETIGLQIAQTQNGEPVHLVSAGPSPNGALVEITGPHTISYTPKHNWTGTDVFPYTISDPHGATATTTVTVVVFNPLPVADAGPSYVEYPRSWWGRTRVRLDGSRSQDPDGTWISQYRWTGDRVDPANEKIATVYLRQGTYRFWLRVVDSMTGKVSSPDQITVVVR